MRLLLAIVTLMMPCGPSFGAWGRFNEKADDPIPCGGKTPFEWWIKRHEAMAAEAKKGDAQIVFFGDSFVDFWRKQGEPVWEKEYAPMKAANFGIGGDQTQYVIYRMTHGELAGLKARVVVLEIGTNNMAAGKQTPEETIIGIKGIVKHLREKLPQTKVLLLGLFPQGHKSTDSTLNAVNAEIAKLDDGRMIKYLDFGAKFLDANGNIISDLRSDGVHLSKKGYQVWADEMRETLAGLMASGPAKPPVGK